MNLNKIYIRAKLGESWDSYSIQELIDREAFSEIKEWAFNRMMGYFDIGNDAKSIGALLALMKAIGIPLYHVKDDDELPQ